VPEATVEKNTTPFAVLVLTPLRIAFLTELLVAALWKQTVAPLVFVFDAVRSFVVPPTVFEPSTTTKLDPLRVSKQVADEPEIVGAVAEAGLIVSVLVALAPVFPFKVIGNVSLPE
jgi:hypothetical protein